MINSLKCFIVFLGWYFTMSFDIPDMPGVKSLIKEGPFRSEVICNEHREDHIIDFQFFGMKALVSKCFEEKTL